MIDCESSTSSIWMLLKHGIKEKSDNLKKRTIKFKNYEKISHCDIHNPKHYEITSTRLSDKFCRKW